MSWNNRYQIPPQKYTCGHCDSMVASDRGYQGVFSDGGMAVGGMIPICPHCDQPTYLACYSDKTIQIPTTMVGRSVEHLPSEVQELYNEARQCAGASSYTAAVMICRKLLMHLAVEKGAEKNQSFREYVDYLDREGYLPPNSKGWVDHIRNQGNEANHEIILKKESDAMKLIEFIEMLTKFIYEFPARVSGLAPENDGENS